MISWPQLSNIYVYARNIFFAITASSASIGGGIVTYKVIKNDTVLIEQIKVPSAFEDLGYTSEIVTARILDDITYLNNRTISAKDRSKFVDSKIDLDNIDTNFAGISFKEIAASIGEFFGKEIKRISGEITLIKDGDKITYKVRIRQTPDRIMLVEFEESALPDQIIRKTALKLIEKTDPHIAAALYQGVFRDNVNAYRMIDYVLSGENRQSYKYSLNLRSLMFLNDGKYEDAWNDLLSSLEIDPDFPATHANIANYYIVKKDYDKALDSALRAIDKNPNSPFGYLQKARIYRQKGDYDLAILNFKIALEKDKKYIPAYNLMALTYLDQNKFDEAKQWILKGIIARPESPYFYLNYGKILTKQGKHNEAVVQFKAAVEIDNNNPEFLMALADCYSNLKKTNDRNIIINKISSDLNSGLYSYSSSAEKEVRNYLQK